MLASRLGEFAAGIDAAALPREVVDAVRLRVLDTLGVGLAGVALGNHKVLDPVLETSGAIRVWGERVTRSAREAALVNSFAVHSTYMEDGSRYTGGHPSSVVIPAVLAEAQARRATGADIIAAVLAGYEVFLRLGRAIYPACVNRGFQSTAVLAAVSSAAALARLRKLAGHEAGQAIAIGANLGSGLKEALKSSAVQPIQVARGCEGGMIAAALAAAGRKGAPLVLENGFLPGHGDTQETASILDGLGQAFRIGETYLKRHAGCRGNHAPVDAALDLIAQEDLRAGDVRRVRVAVDSVTRAASIEAPTNGEQAQFSIGYSVALAFVEGAASIFDYSDAKLADPAILSMMARTEVLVDASLDVRYPVERGAWVEVELASGRLARAQVTNARGEPESPLSAQEVGRKFLGLAAPRLGERTHALRDAIEHLENVDAEGIAALLAPSSSNHEPL